MHTELQNVFHRMPQSTRTATLPPASKSHSYSRSWMSKNNIQKLLWTDIHLSTSLPSAAWLSLIFTICLDLSSRRPEIHSFYHWKYEHLKYQPLKEHFSTRICFLLSCTLGLCMSLCMICMFVLCLCVCVRGPLLINVTSYCNGACWTCSDICNVLPVSAWFYCHGLIGYCHYHNLD